MIKLNYEGNLEKDIKNYKNNFNFEKLIKSHLISDVLLSSMFTLVGVYGFNMEAFGAFSKAFVTVLGVSALSIIKEKVSSKYSKKKATKKLRKLAKEVNNYVTKTNEKPLINGNSFKYSMQREENKEIVNTDSEGKVVVTKNEIIKDYCLLNRRDKINILREVRSRIKYSNGETLKENNLYLLSDNEYYAEYEDNTLKLKK